MASGHGEGLVVGTYESYIVSLCLASQCHYHTYVINLYTISSNTADGIALCFALLLIAPGVVGSAVVLPSISLLVQ
jgi:hypothetical protein